MTEIPNNTTQTQQVEKRKKEPISLNQELPDNLKETLGQLKEDVPEEWRKQAERTAFFIWSLDEERDLVNKKGNSLREERKIFKEQLATAGFIHRVYNTSGKDSTSQWNIKPEESLPTWLYQEHISQSEKPLSEEEINSIRDFYSTYTREHGQEYPAKGQTYHNYNEGVPEKDEETVSETKRCKGYVEENGLRNIPNLETALEKLREVGLHPHTTKLFAYSPLVLYWRTNLTNEQKSRIRTIFKDQNINIRAFAQDPQKIMIKGNKYETKVRASNDGSLGEGKNPFYYKESHYESNKFLHDYLQITYWGCKDPSRPYQISFVPIITKFYQQEHSKELVRQLQKQIRQIDGLPSIIVESGFFDCFEKR